MINYLLFAAIGVLLLFIGYWAGKNANRLKHESALRPLENSVSNHKLLLENSEKKAEEHKEDHRLQSEKTEREFRQQLSKIQLQREEIRHEKELYKNELTRKNVEFDNLQQQFNTQKEETVELQKKFQQEFENLANKIFEQESKKFTSQNKENIQNILTPLQEKIKGFEEKVEKNSSDNIKRHAELGKQLQYLNEQNLKISEEAINLTKALKGDTKIQGNWGEMILERVLERSGLQKNSEYFVQQKFTTEEGKRVYPDVVIELPGNKKLIIDSKVSLNAYERYTNETDETHKPAHLKNHLISVKKKVNELSQKNYQQLYQMESPDFVLLFIPIEAAFAIASNEYPQLYADAFEKNIIIVTPTTLLAVLKTIDSMWQNEKQKQNAIDIATQAGALYDSFTNLTEELLKVGRQLGTVRNSYEVAMKKLTGKGNLIRRVERLKKLGAKTSKQLDEKLISRSEDDGETE